MGFSAHGDIDLWKIVSNDGRMGIWGLFYLQQRDDYAMTTEIPRLVISWNWDG